MPPVPSEISRDELRAFLQRQGFRVSPHQLLRWHDWGLLPQPKRKGLGRGKGTASYYPVGAVLQARALARLLAQRRSLIEAGWGLWMLGFPVTDWARDCLLDDLQERRRQFGKAERSLRENGRLTRQVSQRRAPKALKRVRKRMRPETMPRIFRMLVALQLGSLRAEHYSENDWANLQEAVVFESAPELADDPALPSPADVAAGLATLSSEINLDRTIAALKAIPNQRLEQYRNEVQWLYELSTPPDERPSGLVSRDDFVRFFRARHLRPDGERGMNTLLGALEQTHSPASSLDRWLAAGKAATARAAAGSGPAQPSNR